MTSLFVAKPLLPDLEDLAPYLKEIWASQIVTNQGPMHNRLERELAGTLDVPVSVLFNNGTTALQCALLALKLPPGSEVITTPLTFAATAHVIAACGLKPIFADVDDDTLTLDPRAVERAITERTSAVIAVHVYGTICDHAGLDQVCKAHQLKLIYDAAHAFAASVDDIPVGTLGDLSVFSLHATKLFNTFEGGLVTASNSDAEESLRLVRNFGIRNEEHVAMVGLNGKMNELNAAVGLLNLKIFEEERRSRTHLRQMLDEIIDAISGLRKQVLQPGVQQSEQYYMIRIDPEIYGSTRDDVYEHLKARQIMSRRYFWPICTDFDCYRNEQIVSIHDTPIAERVKQQVLCLPFHSGVQPHHIATISEVLYALSTQSKIFAQSLDVQNLTKVDDRKEPSIG